ncbi:hypothetical protein BKA62DRAFT_748647 [Auriculariales sp. MPI-PUGE-AT-0066]|nr:hypothetical protein BKA62DRAFT_748647 [Auriculariales sp. MPI-PUGE-AT-0066]
MPTKGTLPRGWPTACDVEYISHQCYAKGIPSSIVEHLRGWHPLTSTTPCPLVQIRRITAQHHPAHGQCGLFAARKIAAKAHILDYFGEVHIDLREGSDYDLSLVKLRATDFPDAKIESDWISVGIDAVRRGNEARFVNDYRGISETPNTVFQERVVDGQLRIGVFAGSRSISKNR